MGFLIRLIVNVIALYVVVRVVPGVHGTDFWGLVIAAVILGIVNAILRPILFIITLPLQIVTLGLFTLVINGLLFWLVGSFHVGLYVDGFWPGFWGAIVMGIVSWILSALTGGLEGDRQRPVAR
jgi:putative membrane protein